jgi:hypothetical protein
MMSLAAPSRLPEARNAELRFGTLPLAGDARRIGDRHSGRKSMKNRKIAPLAGWTNPRHSFNMAAGWNAERTMKASSN